jgi:hypothetical protein
LNYDYIKALQTNTESPPARQSTEPKDFAKESGHFFVDLKIFVTETQSTASKRPSNGKRPTCWSGAGHL